MPRKLWIFLYTGTCIVAALTVYFAGRNREGDEAGPNGAPNAAEDKIQLWRSIWNENPDLEIVLRDSLREAETQELSTRAVANAIDRADEEITVFYLLLLNRHRDFFGLFTPLEFDTNKATLVLTLADGRSVENIALDDSSDDTFEGLFVSSHTGSFKVPAGHMTEALFVFPGKIEMTDIEGASVEFDGNLSQLEVASLDYEEYSRLLSAGLKK
ncbi:MAG: hypothetical protein NUW37_16050 [Planctomycetes bacterium]|nr:hypothetical protein [Planctomycetota bacterium]